MDHEESPKGREDAWPAESLLVLLPSCFTRLSGCPWPPLPDPSMGIRRFVSLPWRAPDKAGDERSDHVLCAKHWVKHITTFTSFSQDP